MVDFDDFLLFLVDFDELSRSEEGAAWAVCLSILVARMCRSCCCSWDGWFSAILGMIVSLILLVPAFSSITLGGMAARSEISMAPAVFALIDKIIITVKRMVALIGGRGGEMRVALLQFKNFMVGMCL